MQATGFSLQEPLSSRGGMTQYMHISTRIKKRFDEKTDTLWEVCSFCNAELRDFNYVGHNLFRENDGSGVHIHIAAEHGERSMGVGKHDRWIHLSPEDQDRARKYFDEWIRRFGKDAIHRVSDYYPHHRRREGEEA
jgi:hypothetical protein